MSRSVSKHSQWHFLCIQNFYLVKTKIKQLKCAICKGWWAECSVSPHRRCVNSQCPSLSCAPSWQDVPRWAAGFRKLLWWGGGPKGVPAGCPPPAKTKQKGQFPARAQRGAHSALGCPFFTSSGQLTLLCPAWGSQGPMQGAAAFPNRNTQLGNKGCRGMNVSGQKQKGNAYEIHLSSNIWSPRCIRHHSVRKCSFIYYLAVFQQVGLFIKAYRIILKYLSNRLIAPGMSCREFISQSIWEIHGKDQHFNEQGARRGFHFQYSLAVEKRVDGRARSWGWWMAPKRLGPGGLLRNSGFRPKSSLCGSDCICFWNGKQDLEETVWKGNSKRHFQNGVGRAAHSYWCFNKNIGF